jgi:hypothetical protein
MRTFTVSGGIETFVTLQEGKWLDTHAEDRVYKADLNERERWVAKQLCKKGILNLHVREGKTFYTRNVNKVVS